MSGSKTKPVRKVLPVIPAGVQPISPIPSALSKSHTPSAFKEATSHLILRKTLQDGEGSSVRVTLPSHPRKSPRDGEDSSVRVAVRVRPFSKREVVMGANLIISMTGNRTSITSSKGKVHLFSFDHCFWSVSNEREGSNHAGQDVVYKELAQPLLDNSFKGYNTCLFAYGQTGSGKSYSIMGEKDEPGIVPHFTKELFGRIDGTSDSKNLFNVQVSYYEIYSEKVYDLLSSTSKQLSTERNKLKLRVREHKVFGPYVEDLSTYVATSYTDIEHWLMIGNRCRATTATSMNDRSSRSHAVFSITLTHTTLEEEEEHNRVSRINIIDLAGSERSKVSGTSGEKLKEGASINRSLHSLGKVISLLSDLSTGRREKVYIPYRDSTLTWLLKESLGGNSKTAMIATISPADLHYEESLNTLRYAQQARSIVNVARINEDPNIKMIRELNNEIHHLRGLLKGGETASLAEIKRLKEQLSESEKLMADATRTWKEKLQQTEERKKQELEELKQTGPLTVINRLPNLVNLTEDPQLSETLLYLLKAGRTTVGNASNGEQSHDIELTGALVVKDHCVFIHDGNSVHVEPSTNPDAQTYVNGHLLSSCKQLHHGDRVVLGGDYFFRFNYPLEVEGGASIKKGHRDFEYARNELVRAQTERLEKELEERRLKEREELLSELESMRRTAQDEMDRQQMEYQDKIQELSKIMETQTQTLTEEQRFKLAAEMHVEELLRQNQALEEETAAQRHIIHLEKIKTEKEARELEEQRNQLMLDLEQEKQRLEEDIHKLHLNKSIRDAQTSSSAESFMATSQSSLSDTSVFYHSSELVRISVMLQEAAAICKALDKPLTFAREDSGDNVSIRVTNSQLNMVSYWDMVKFEARLEQMREMYQSREFIASADSENSVSPTFHEDPFNNESDEWVPSPLKYEHSKLYYYRIIGLMNYRSLPHRLSLQYSPAVSTPASSGSIHRDLYHSKSSYNTCSLLLPDTPTRNRTHLFSNTTAVAVLKHINRIVDTKEAGSHEVERCSMLGRMADYLCIIKEYITKLADMIQQDVIETEVWASLAVSIYSCLEALVETSRCFQELCLQWRLFMAHYPLKDHTSAVDLTSLLLQTLCYHTALHITKLFKEDELVESYVQELHGSLDTVGSFIGQLILVREVQTTLLSTHLHSPDSQNERTVYFPWDECSSMKPAIVEGLCKRCVTTIDTVSQSVDNNLSTISNTESSSLNYDEGVVKSVQHLMCSVLTFLQRLTEIQGFVWCADSELPLCQAIDMLLLLQQLSLSMRDLTYTIIHQQKAQPLLKSDSQQYSGAPALCNELAVCVLKLVKASQVDAVKMFWSEVQSLSQQMAAAGKNFIQLLKRKGVIQDQLENMHHNGHSVSYRTI